LEKILGKETPAIEDLMDGNIVVVLIQASVSENNKSSLFSV
jgi:hypothetical protein